MDDSAAKKKQLQKLAKSLKGAKSKSEYRRLMTQLDGILEIEASPEEEDGESAEAWERNNRTPPAG